MSKRHTVRFHSFYMRWEVCRGRKVIARFVSEDDAIRCAWSYNYPSSEDTDAA